MSQKKTSPKPDASKWTVTQQHSILVGICKALLRDWVKTGFHWTNQKLMIKRQAAAIPVNRENRYYKRHALSPLSRKSHRSRFIHGCSENWYICSGETSERLHPFKIKPRWKSWILHQIYVKFNANSKGCFRWDIIFNILRYTKSCCNSLDVSPMPHHCPMFYNGEWCYGLSVPSEDNADVGLAAI